MSCATAKTARRLPATSQPAISSLMNGAVPRFIKPHRGTSKFTKELNVFSVYVLPQKGYIDGIQAAATHPLVTTFLPSFHLSVYSIRLLIQTNRRSLNLGPSWATTNWKWPGERYLTSFKTKVCQSERPWPYFGVYSNGSSRHEINLICFLMNQDKVFPNQRY